MSSFIRYICAVAFVLMLALSASASDVFNPAELSPVERTEIGGDIAHYTYEITVDLDPYGKIRLHRFIREPYPYQPIPNLKGILFLPGGWATIMGTYAASLSSEHAAWDHSLLVYLAKNNIDVWGLDFAWAFVPAETEDFHFMKNWTITRDVRHATAALSIARSIREYTSQGTSKLNLAGHSYGVAVGYSVLSEETKKTANQRIVGGFIPVDGVVTGPPDSWDCTGADELQATWDSGTYANGRGLFLVSIAWLAESNPEGPSDMIPGFTNYQTFLYFAANLFGHYINKDGVVTGLRFTDPQLANDVYRGFAPYLPVKVLWELAASGCGEIVAGFEHINQITVPILYFGAIGGVGDNGFYTLTLTESEDITEFQVQLLPDKKAVLDFGHADLFGARDAETLVWKPILDWINAH